jgi:membrane-associated protein
VADWWTSLTDLTSMTSTAVYVVVLTLVFVESGLLIGFFLPGDSVLFAAGLLSADPDRGISLPVLAVTVAIAAVAGDAVGYWMGRRLGRPWLLRRAGRAARRVDQAEEFYRRWGALAVIIARFIPWVRTFTPIVAGVGRMPYSNFLAANLTGALLWASGLVVLGHQAADNPAIKWAAYAIAAVAILMSLLVPVVARFRRKPISGRIRPSE